MSDGDKKDEHSASLGLGQVFVYTCGSSVHFFLVHSLTFKLGPSLDNKLYSHYSHLSDKYYEKKKQKRSIWGKILIFSSMTRNAH